MAIRIEVKPEFQQLLHNLCSDEQDYVDSGCNAIQQGNIDLQTWVAQSDREDGSHELFNLISYVAMYVQPRFQAGIFNIILEASPQARSEIDREFRYQTSRATATTVLYKRSCKEGKRAFDEGLSALLHARADILKARIPLQKEHLLHHAIFLSAAASPVVTDETHFPLELTQLVIEYIGGIRARNDSGRFQADAFLKEDDLKRADPEVLEFYASLGFNPLKEPYHRCGDGYFSSLHPRIALSEEQRQALQRGFQASIPFLDADDVYHLARDYEKIGNWAWGQESLTKLTKRQIDWLPGTISIDSLPTALISIVVQSRIFFLPPIADLVASYVKNSHFV